MSNISVDQLTEWRYLCAHATAGPWSPKVWEDEEEDNWKSVTVHDENQHDVIIGGVMTDNVDEITALTANAAFIATAREAMPLLLDEVDRMRHIAEIISERLGSADMCPAVDCDAGIECGECWIRYADSIHTEQLEQDGK